MVSLTEPDSVYCQVGTEFVYIYMCVCVCVCVCVYIYIYRRTPYPRIQYARFQLSSVSRGPKKNLEN